MNIAFIWYALGSQQVPLVHTLLLFQHLFGIRPGNEMLKGVEISGFSYLPCDGGFRWTTNLESDHDSGMPIYQQEPVRRAIQNFWDSNGSNTSLYLEDGTEGCFE